MKLSNFRKSSGFTLVELLIVIAVLGVLAAVVLVAINPLEQLARGRDAGRKSTVSQLGNAVNSSYTGNSVFPTVAGTWITGLVTSGELKVTPTNPAAGAYTPACNIANTGQNGYCYNTDTTNAIVYVLLESSAAKSKCGATEATWEVWSSADGKAGIVCTTNATTDPVVGAQTFVGQ